MVHDENKCLLVIRIIMKYLSKLRQLIWAINGSDNDIVISNRASNQELLSLNFDLKELISNIFLCLKQFLWTYWEKVTVQLCTWNLGEKEMVHFSVVKKCFNNWSFNQSFLAPMFRLLFASSLRKVLKPFFFSFKWQAVKRSLFLQSPAEVCWHWAEFG